MQAVTFRQPWAAAVAHFGKDVDNRSWKTSYRGLLAVHVGTRRPAGRDMAELAELIATRAGVATSQVLDAAVAGTSVIAVASLADVCAATREHGDGRCVCGVWAQPGAFHLRLADVRPLAEPVPVTGAAGGQTLWALPYGVEKAIRAQLAALRPPELAGVRPAPSQNSIPVKENHCG